MLFLFPSSLVIGCEWDFFETIYPFDVACVRVDDAVDIFDLCWLESVVSVLVSAGPVTFSVLVLVSVSVLGSVVPIPAVVVPVVYTRLVLVLIPVLGEMSPVIGSMVVGWVAWGAPTGLFLAVVDA